ncbi:MAG: hypothetical protein M1300_06795 [Epsilonproteobacteria bacterium]|nr:hypothetical protein [Campylobacterota bacterium]
MTKENHVKLEALSPQAKSAYVAAKGHILEALREMDLFEGAGSLTDKEKNTIIELLNETAFLMKSEETR